MTRNLDASASPAPLGRAERVPRFFEPRRIHTPHGNPPPKAERLEALIASMREVGQLMPGFICPSTDLEPEDWLCLEGNTRLEACRRLGLPFWAIDLERMVPEAEQIRLIFHHNNLRRVMSREEIVERAARFMVVANCTQAVAAKQLGLSQSTLSRAIGDQRIPDHLRERVERLCPSSRYVISSVPAQSMERAVTYAETPNAFGDKPTRDELAGFVKELRKNGNKGKGGVADDQPTPSVLLIINGRKVTLTVGESDTHASVVDDLNAMLKKLGKHIDVPPQGWGYLFQ